jgi:hypothetical protein
MTIETAWNYIKFTAEDYDSAKIIYELYEQIQDKIECEHTDWELIIYTYY